MMMETDGTADARYARAFLYEMAHTVFGGEPDETLFSALCSPDCRGTLQAMGALSAGGAVARLAEYVKRLAADEDVRARELRRSVSDFNRVVVGLGADRTSHPWESAYTNSKRLLFQAETLDVRNAYRAFGYLPECYPRVADDHIALECAFMAALARKSLEVQDDEELACLEAGQRAFLQDHFLRWIGDYARDLRVDAPGGLYELTAAALAEFAASNGVCEGTAG